MTGRTVSLTATLVALPPAALTVRSVSFRIEVRTRVPSSRVRCRDECRRWEPPREVRPRGLRGFGRRMSRGPGSAAELSQCLRPLALRARLAASLPLSIRRRMIVEDRLRVVARSGAVRSPIWGMRWEGLPARITPKGHAPRDRIAETVCVWQFRLPLRYVHQTAARPCNRVLPPNAVMSPPAGLHPEARSRRCMADTVPRAGSSRVRPQLLRRPRRRGA